MDRITTREVRTYEVNMSCNKCDFGFMYSTGNTFLTYPAQYEHKCNQCDNVENFNITFPYIKHV